MLELISRATKIYQRQGLTTLIKKIWQLDINQSIRYIAEYPYQIIKPSTITLCINNMNATFDRGPTSLINYDFTEDFEAEQAVLQNFLSDVQSSDVVYDIGANVGLYSIFSASVVEPKNIVAFEPHPKSAQLLRKNSHLNEAGITIYDVALSDSEGHAILEPNPPTAHKLREDGPDGIKVTMRRGDKLIRENNLPHPTVIKIDVEGAELSVLKGLGTVLSSEDCRCVYCEIHPHKSNTDQLKQTISQLLEEAGFKISTLDVDGQRTNLRGIKE